MTSAKGKSFSLSSSGLGLMVVLIIGAGLGYFFSADLYNRPPHVLMRSVALGLVWALLLVQWVDIILQSFSLGADPVPDELDLNDSDAVAQQAESLGRGSMLVARARRLLAARANGADGSQLVDLASFQSQQAKNAVHATLAFSVVLLVAALWDAGNNLLSWGAILLLAVTLYARRNLLSRIDLYLETQLLSRVPASAGAAPASPAESAAPALDAAFESIRADFDKLNESIGNLATQMNGAGGNWSKELEGILAQHSDSMQAANQQVTSQLDRILELQKEVEKVLHLNEAVDGTLKSVAATEEFQQTMASLRSHLEASDKALQELSKPRKIRLVESAPQNA